MTDVPTPSEPESKREIASRARAFRKRERDARNEALRAVLVLFQEERDAIEGACEASGGHDWYAMTGSFVKPHFHTGKWPHRCRFCDRRGYHDRPVLSVNLSPEDQ